MKSSRTFGDPWEDPLRERSGLRTRRLRDGSVVMKYRDVIGCGEAPSGEREQLSRGPKTPAGMV